MGSAALTLAPRQEESTGVSRQPRVICPSAATIFSTMSSTIRRPSLSRGKNSAPMAYSPGAGSAAMIEIAQNLEAHGDHFVRLAIAHVRDETHPAGGMLLGGRIKALR